jgi:glycosyltransferase involved in cell wall biosynthesis
MTFKAGIAAKKISGKPLIVHVHATEFDRAGIHGNPDVHALEKEGFEEANHIIAVSDWTKNVIADNYKIAREKISVVHNGVTTKDTTSEFSDAFEGPIVSFLGRVTYQKGPLFFVEAAEKVLKKFPHANFVVAGAGDLLPLMIERVASRKLSKNFHFTGFLREPFVNKVWAISDVYVMPSVSEPFGLTPLEAIQAGVPVIISNQSGVGEVMPHAIKVDFWNTNALAEAICSVLQYKGLSSTMKKNAFAELKNISWMKAAEKIKKLYYDIKNQPSEKA